ncbi:unnamed protein product [Arabis nemorensis]|uniref:Uncharacterized protein n=1 Tax=Arabis nemorensis TaxID=586526 RepID=A0A565C7B0_9BRAS|nr:unnamed protein product [Arabis nemorensis]
MEEYWKRETKRGGSRVFNVPEHELGSIQVKWLEFHQSQEVNVMYQGTIQQYLRRLQELGVHDLKVNKGDGETHAEMYKHLFRYPPLLFAAEAHLIEYGDKTCGKIFLRCRPR